MKLLLLVFCFAGLFYCLWKIAKEIYFFCKYSRMFKFATYAFNIQYKMLRPFLKEELSDKQILKKLKENNEDIDVISNDNEIIVLFIREGGIICKNTSEIRTALLHGGELIEKLREFLEISNVFVHSDVISENEKFIRELKSIRYQKGEPMEFNPDIYNDEE